MEHEEQAERMEEDAERMEDHSDQLGDQIDEVQSDWEGKERDPAVPGAQPAADDEEEPVPGVSADKETLSEEGGP